MSSFTLAQTIYVLAAARMMADDDTSCGRNTDLANECMRAAQMFTKMRMKLEDASHDNTKNQ